MKILREAARKLSDGFSLCLMVVEHNGAESTVIATAPTPEKARARAQREAERAFGPGRVKP